MLLREGKKPIVLLLGEVILAHAEWNDLGALAELRVRPKVRNIIVKSTDKRLVQQVNEGTRNEFLEDCKAGAYDGVVAISRTYDSTQASSQS